MLRLHVSDGIHLVMPLDRFAAPLFELIDAERDRISTWVDVDGIRTVEDERAALRAGRVAMAHGTQYPLVIEVDGEVAGTLTLYLAPGRTHVAEIGYVLGRRFEGRGVVTRATEALISSATTELGVRRFEIRCAVGNARSRAVPRRLGFVEEGTLRASARIAGRYEDEVLHALVTDAGT